MLVGFDLDMTLVNSAEGIAATVRAVLAEIGIPVTAQQVWPYVGPPLSHVLRDLAPGHAPDPLIARYRELYPSLGIPSITVLPGARETLDLLRTEGHEVAVVSAKLPAVVERVLTAVGLQADHIAGGLFAEQKGTWLRAHDAVMYVGDHPGDMVAARVAGAVGLGVSTGPHDAAALEAAGADDVLDDLRGFAQWWTTRGRTLARDDQWAITGDAAPGTH
jgi:phosphoglycolate phosphatase